MRPAHVVAAFVAVVAGLSACSIVSTGLNDETPLGDAGGTDTSTSDDAAKPDLGFDTKADDVPADTFVGIDAIDAADAIDAIDAIDAADVRDTADTFVPIDTFDAADTSDTRDTADAFDSAPPPLCSTDPDLVACFRFENDGFAKQPHDESIYGNHGSTFTGASFVPGVHGSAVSLGGTSVVKVPDSASLDVTRITMELRFRPSALPTGTRAGLLDDNGQYGFFIMNGGRVHCSVSTPVSAALDSPAVVAVVGKWTHVACTYDGIAIIMYVDGKPVTYAAATGNIDGATTDGLTIGMNSPSGDNFVGEIDDFRIWRRALTGAEICASYNSGSGATCP